MCGINGIITDDIRIKKKIIRLNKLLSHRGPDDEGFVLINTNTGNFKPYSGADSVPLIKEKYPDISTADFVENNLIFGHRRLSIIDLSERGHCPMSDGSGKIWITYNGEIYNYIELREELLTKGYIFRTDSDTEVIIHSYIEWGEKCLERFNGMWSFALWDGYRNQLLLSRDRFGVKPLYYVSFPNLFAFSSEIKPLVILLENAELDKTSIPFFILYGNRLDKATTFVRGINSLLSSSFLILNDGKINIKKYYDVKIDSSPELDESKLCKKLESLLTDSIKLRFRSDVPVGACLSGGFDSSAIVAISSELKKEGIKTFSAVWDDKDCDETRFIDIVNNRFNCLPNKIEPKAEEFESLFNQLNYYQEIPSEGPGLYPQWHVMSKAKGEVKVLLDGQGGDELFGGYFSEGIYLLSIIKDRNLKKLVSDFLSFRIFLNKNGAHSFFTWIFPKLYGKLGRQISPQKFRILNSDFLREVDIDILNFDSEPPKKFKNYLNNLSYHFLTSFTIPALLHYEDRSSMAFSIESRVPFLDYRLVEFGLNLKPEYLFRNKVQRYIFRKAIDKKLPAEIVSRKDKLGFPTPFAEWTRGLLKNYIRDILLNDNANIYSYLDKKTVKSNLVAHLERKKDYSWDIWRILSLERIINIYNSLN